MGSAVAGAPGDALVLTCNINGGLLPSVGELDGAGRGGSKLMYLVSLFHPTALGGERSADVVCIQEPGLFGQVPPVTVTSVMGSHRFLLHGSPPGRRAMHGVAVAIHSDWSVLRVLRDDSSCRAMGVLLERDGGARRLFVVNLYLPSNLDRLGADSAEVIEAVDLCELARGWIRDNAQAAYGNVLLCGDLNQTLLPGSAPGAQPVWERTLRGQGVARDDGCARILENHLLAGASPEARLVDLYRALHPTADAAESHTRDGMTAFGYSTSRIDYVLVLASLDSPDGDGATLPFPNASYRCRVERSGEATDHATVAARVPLLPDPSRDSTAPLPGDGDPCPKPPYARGLSDGQRRACATAIETAVARDKVAWMSALSLPPCGGHDSAHSVLTAVQGALVTAILSAVRHILPRGPPRSRKFLSGRVLTLRRAARAIRAVKAELRCRAGAGWVHLADARWKLAVNRLRRTGETCPELDDAISAWTDWASGAAPVRLAELTTAILRETALMRDHPRFAESEALADPQKMGRYMDRMLEGAANRDRISTVTDPVTGKPVGAADRVKDVVRDQVSAPFQTTFSPRPYDPAIFSLRPCSGRCRTPARSDRPDKAVDPRFVADEPGVCFDARCTGCLPEWWDRVYHPLSGLFSPSVYDNLMSPPSLDEVRRTIAGAPAGTAAGLDLLSIDVLKIAVDASLLLPLGQSDAATPPGSTSCLEVLTAMTSFALQHACNSDFDKRCWTALIPKPDGAGGMTRDPDQMRPLTLSTEIYKIRARILARRLGDTFLQHPQILSSAQRGFLRDGDAGQPVTVVLDAMEDFAENRGNGGGSETLVCLLYDQRKAYDRVQRFALEAALRRLCLPEHFIRYVLDGMQGTRSSVRTAHGLTEEYDILCGVRQGCPLAPLLYLCFIDPLLRGLEHLPTGLAGLPPAPWDPHPPGYRFSGDAIEAVPVASYADDTTALELETGAESYRTLLRHEWVRQWLGANLGAINIDKCVYYSHGPARPAVLLSVDGRFRIPPTPTSEASRLLGVYLSPSLDWKPFLDRLSAKVNTFCGILSANKPSLEVAVHAVNAYLLPRLEIGLRFLPLVEDIGKVVRRWDTRIRDTVLRSADLPADRRFPTAALRVITDLQMPSDMHWLVQAAELVISLNSWMPDSNAVGVTHASPDRPDPDTPLQGTPSSRTTWLRLSAATGTALLPGGRVDYESVLGSIGRERRLPAEAYATNRLHALLRALRRHRVLLRFNPEPWFSASTSVRLEGECPLAFRSAAFTWLAEEPGFERMRHLLDRTDVAFVDAPDLVRMPLHLDASQAPTRWTSYGDGSASGVFSGFAATSSPGGPDSRMRAIVGRMKARHVVYSNEKLAHVAGHVLSPADKPEDVATDCLSGVFAIQGSRFAPPDGVTATKTLSNRGRIRQGARPVLNTERKMISCRRFLFPASHTHYRHVLGHTGGQDLDSTMNDLGDWLANAARRWSARSYEHDFIPDVTYNDELVLVYLQTRRYDEDGASYLPTPHHVDGDIRRALKRQLVGDLVEEWANHPGLPGEFARRYGSLMAEHCRAVRRARVPGSLRASLLVLCQAYALLPPGVHGQFCAAYPEEWHQTQSSAVCPLCHSGARVDTRHMLLCPAVAGAVSDTCARAYSVMDHALPRPLRSAAGDDHLSRAMTWARRALAQLPAGMQESRCDDVATMFATRYSACRETSRPPVRIDFSESAVRVAVSRVNTIVRTAPWKRVHHTVPLPVLRCIVGELRLSTEAFASAADHNVGLFPYWFSDCGADAHLGAELDFLAPTTDWGHRSIWANPLLPADPSASPLPPLLARAKSVFGTLDATPVRLVLVMPEVAGALDSYGAVTRLPGVTHRCLLRIPAGSPFFGPPAGWPPGRVEGLWGIDTPLSVVMLANEASMLTDPVDWTRLAESLASAVTGTLWEAMPADRHHDVTPVDHCAHGWLEPPSSCPEYGWRGRAIAPPVTPLHAPRRLMPWRVGIGALVHFFDPRCAPVLAALQSHPTLAARPAAAVAHTEQAHFDRLAGLAGMLPMGLSELLRWQGSTRRDVDRMCDRLRATLLAGMVRTVQAYQAQLGSYLMHAAPREALLYATLDSQPARRRAARSTAVQPGGVPNDGPVLRRSSRLIRRRADRDTDFVYDVHDEAAETTHFAGARLAAVRSIARSWRAAMPSPGACYDPGEL